MGLGIAGALFEEFCNDGGLLLPSVVILALLAGYSLRSRDTRLAPRMRLAALAGYSLRSRDTRCARGLLPILYFTPYNKVGEFIIHNS